MDFDFTPFRERPPSGFTVLQADKECLRLSRKSLKDKSIHVFTITKTEPEIFSLYYGAVGVWDEGRAFKVIIRRMIETR